MKTAAYVRFSDDRQKETSLEDQLRVIQEWATGQGHTIVAIFSNAALKGSSVAPRQGLQELLTELESPHRRFELVAVHQLSRLSRSIGDTCDIVFNRLKFYKIPLVAVADGIDSRNYGAKIHVAIKSVQNEQFLDDQRVNVKRGMDGQFLRGYSTGSLPFGYSSNPIYKPGRENDPRSVIGYRVMINSDQANVVRDIFQRYLDGEGYRTIARVLNASTDLNFTHTRIAGILQNPMYVGRRVFNKHEHATHPDTGKTIVRLRDETDWLHYTNPDLVIVDEETWKRVNELMTNRKGLFENRKPAAKHLLTGLLFCGQCHGPISIVQHSFYGCPRAYLHDKKCTNQAVIQRESLEQVVIEAVSNYLPGHLDMLIESVRHRIAASFQENQGIQERIKNLDAQAERLLAGIRDAQFTGRAKQKAESQYQQLNDQIEALERTKATAGTIPVAVNYDRGVLKAFIADLPEALASDRQAGAELLAHLIKRVDVQSGDAIQHACPLCDAKLQKIGPPHARKHNMEFSQFLRKFPWLGCTNEMKLSVTFNAQGLFKKEKIVGLEVKGTLTFSTDDFMPTQIAITAPKIWP